MKGLEPQAVDWLGWAGDEKPRHVQQRSEIQTFLRFLESLSTHGEGYAEVTRGDQSFPMLALSAASGHGVIHQFQSQDKSYLLCGDGSVPTGQVVDLPIIEGLATFSGDFVLTLDLAVGAIEAFARGAAVAQLGVWVELRTHSHAAEVKARPQCPPWLREPRGGSVHPRAKPQLRGPCDLR